MHGSINYENHFKNNTKNESNIKIDKMTNAIADMFVSFGFRQDTAIVRAKSWARELTYYSIETINEACHYAKNNADQMKTLNQFRQIIRNQVEPSQDKQKAGFKPSKQAMNDRAKAQKNWIKALEKYGKEEMQRRLESYMKQNWIVSQNGSIASRLLLMDMIENGEL